MSSYETQNFKIWQGATEVSIWPQSVEINVIHCNSERSSGNAVGFLRELTSVAKLAAEVAVYIVQITRETNQQCVREGVVAVDAQELDVCAARRSAFKKLLKKSVGWPMMERALAKVAKKKPMGPRLLGVGVGWWCKVGAASWCEKQRGLCRQASGGNRPQEAACCFCGQSCGQGCVG